ncbi:calcium/sodium antiporter [Cypionkella sp.]|jgi:cation:H+ antiporter|uniref:calcium/sodium antiporter n=1 Tax=Cypionkella sp. TaxID=2811411 RepID=UPI00274FD0F1|nr:calcium/sodium antiporter [Cypionkella sp.]
MTYVMFLAGLLLLIAGGEGLVRGASGIARHFRISPMVIGLTIVGFGTSAPELLVSLEAALTGQPGLAIGNVVGSNIANILLILGISAVMAPLVIPIRKMYRDFGFMLAAMALMWIMLLDGMIGRLDGAILFMGLIGFLAMAFFSGEVEPIDDMPLPSMPLAWAMTLGGLVGLVLGAGLLVDSASTIARSFGVSEAVIGLSIVAIGTSLPELTTSIIAALRKETEIAVGNVVGSNVFNVFGILGTTALITPIPAEPRFAQVDMVWMAAATALLVLAALKLGTLPRWLGLGFLTLYAAYLAMMA